MFFRQKKKKDETNSPPLQEGHSTTPQSTNTEPLISRLRSIQASLRDSTTPPAHTILPALGELTAQLSAEWAAMESLEREIRGEYRAFRRSWSCRDPAGRTRDRIQGLNQKMDAWLDLIEKLG